MTFTILTLGGFALFCNGYVVAETEAREEEQFFQKWEAYIDENQDAKLGKWMMKIFYIIPTTGALVSRFKHLKQKSL